MEMICSSANWKIIWRSFRKSTQAWSTRNVYTNMAGAQQEEKQNMFHTFETDSKEVEWKRKMV